MVVKFITPENQLSPKELWQLKNKILALIDIGISKRNKQLLNFKHLSIDEIVEKFTFQTMQKECINFCQMLTKDKVCHQLSADKLNCFGCLCPNYHLEITFDKEQELYKIGGCIVKSKFGSYKLTKTKTNTPKEYYIYNCTNCPIPHNKVFAYKQINKILKYKYQKNIEFNNNLK